MVLNPARARRWKFEVVVRDARDLEARGADGRWRRVGRVRVEREYERPY